MAAIKTAISLRPDLFKQMEKLARKMKVSRSELFARAAREFLDRRQSARLVELINRAHVEDTPEERDARREGEKGMARLLEGSW